MVKNNNKLSQLRKEIDNIDIEIINLLQKRYKIVDLVAKYKSSIKDSFLIKPMREFNMINDLIKYNNNSFPPYIIINIWRNIISYANYLEIQKVKNKDNISIAIYNPNNNPRYKYIAQKYYGDLINIDDHQILNDEINQKSDIWLFNIDDINSIDNIIKLYNKYNCKIFTKINYKKENIKFFAAAQIDKYEIAMNTNSILCLQDKNLLPYIEKNYNICNYLAKNLNKNIILEIYNYYEDEEFKKYNNDLQIIGYIPNHSIKMN